MYLSAGSPVSLTPAYTINKIQVRVLPINNTDYVVCLAYGSSAGQLTVSKYGYSMIQNSLYFISDVPLVAGPPVYTSWSFLDRGAPDCSSIALLTNVSLVFESGKLINILLIGE